MIFSVIGICFGTNYSLNQVDTYEFVNTRVWKKILRGIIGSAIQISMFMIFYMGMFDKIKIIFFTRFIIEGVIPYFFIPFLVYGPLITFFQMIGLVDTFEYIDSS